MPTVKLMAFFLPGFLRVAYFGLLGIFHFSLKVLINQRYEMSNYNINVGSLLKLLSLFLNL